MGTLSSDLMNERAETVSLPLADRRSAFVEEHLKRIFVLVYRVVGNVADAQDITQEVFIKALQREEQLRDSARAAQWLSRIASNAAIDFLRRRGRAPQTPIEESQEISDGSRSANPEKLLLTAESHQLFQDALKSLTPRERLALVMRDVEGAPAEEVAQALGCSKATVRSHIANARVKFRKFLRRRIQTVKVGNSAPVVD
jgi:RNA polymerase sigma-70 factor (ECF subfamily)